MKTEIIQQLMWEQHKLGKLIIPKHDPYNLGYLVLPQYRSVVSYDIADNVYKFIDTGIDKIFEYHNLEYIRTPALYEIVPSNFYCTAASGVTSSSVIATSVLDRIIVVDGYKKGLHIFGENKVNIYEKCRQNKLKYKVLCK